MLKQFFFLFTGCLSLFASGQNLSCFTGPDLHIRFPFEVNEMAKLKKAKVKTITASFSEHPPLKTVYYLSEEGLLMSSIYTEGKKRRVIGTEAFKYNKAGQLIIYRSADPDFYEERYDSLVYNSEGRLIGLYGHLVFNPLKKKGKQHGNYWKDVYWNFSLESIDSNFAVLKCKAQYDSTVTEKFTFNRKNECIKVDRDDCRDSLVVTRKGDTIIAQTLTSCYDSAFKYPDRKWGFVVMTESTYKNGKMISEKYPGLKIGPRPYKYVYDSEGKLVYRSNVDSPYVDHHFYLYQRPEPDGLRIKDIMVELDKTTTTTYTYSFLR